MEVKSSLQQQAHGVFRAAGSPAMSVPASGAIKRLYPYDHPFWVEGNIERELTARRWAAVPALATLKPLSEEKAFMCRVQGCSELFQHDAAYTAHYNSQHVHVCDKCKAVFPSLFWLEIHVAERHDAYFRLLAQKQPMVRANCLCLLR
jgi:hypothetical protein